MLVILRSDASHADRDRVVALIELLGFTAQIIEGVQRDAVAIVGNDGRVDAARFSALPGVDEVIQITRPYRMVSREWRAEPTVVSLPGGRTIGGQELLIVAGPCSVESEAQLFGTARAVLAAGAARAPGRRLQAPHFSLCVSGTRRRGPRPSGGGSPRKPDC